MRVRSIVSLLFLAGSMVGTAALAPVAHALSIYTVNNTADLRDSDTGDGACKASNGTCTLRAAVQQANATGEPALIKLSKPGTYTVSLGPAGEHAGLGGDIDIRTDTTIKGLGASKTVIKVDRTSVKDRAFHVGHKAAATFSGLTITNGYAVNDEGGAIENEGGTTVTLVRDVIRDNKADGSGGAISDGGRLVATDTVFDHNVSGNNGGAIRDYFRVTLNGSTISGNTAQGSGGAIDGDIVRATNSTIEGNTGGAGGISSNDPTDTFRLINSTLSGNIPTNLFGSSATLTNVILADAASGGDCKVSTLHATNSLIEDTTNCTPSGSGNVTGQDPNLGVLQNNGGRTSTMALLTGSPALNAGTGTGCPARDQRGVQRPQGSACDIGAYEVPFPAVTEPTASVEHVATFTVAWTVPGGGPAAKTFDVRFRGRRLGHAFGPFRSLADHTTHLHQSFTGQFGFEFCFSARATDAGGNTSPFGPERCVTVEH